MNFVLPYLYQQQGMVTLTKQYEDILKIEILYKFY